MSHDDDQLPEFGDRTDPHTRNHIGQVIRRDRPADRTAEYEASGLFAADPKTPLTPEREAQVRAFWAPLIWEAKEGRAGSAQTDQLEAVYRLAESFSPGHQQLRSPTNPNKSLGRQFMTVIGGARKRKRDLADDIAERVSSPLATVATLLCSPPEGHIQIDVATAGDVLHHARQSLPEVRADCVCGFCHEKRQDPTELRVLLRGHSYWIDARITCRKCQQKIQTSADRIGIALDWVGR